MTNDAVTDSPRMRSRRSVASRRSSSVGRDETPRAPMRRKTAWRSSASMASEVK